MMAAAEVIRLNAKHNELRVAAMSLVVDGGWLRVCWLALVAVAALAIALDYTSSTLFGGPQRLHRSAVVWLNQYKSTFRGGKPDYVAIAHVALACSVGNETLFRGAIFTAVPGPLALRALCSTMLYAWSTQDERYFFALIVGGLLNLVAVYGGLLAAIATHAGFIVATAKMYSAGVARAARQVDGAVAVLGSGRLKGKARKAK